MPDTARSPNKDFSFGKTTEIIERPRSDRWDDLAASAILVLGFPRSGTTWLAKIFDSHPSILYRHEPDELTPLQPGMAPASQMPASQIRAWLRERGWRAAAKRPNFRKSWHPAPLDATRTALAAALAAAQRLEPRLSARIGLPDLVALRRWRQVRAALKLVNWDGTPAARTMPDTRCVFILRHPCGQVASVMAGLAAKRFGDAVMDTGAAATLAARRGIDTQAFDALPAAAKFAWSWLAFNEPAVASLGTLPNARIVIYEDLCHDPAGVSKDLFAFAGLDWHPQTDAFLGLSTSNQQQGGYFDVFRTTEVVADRWRQTMSGKDQESVRAVVATSPLARCWPDLATPLV
jgi:hypothetical protein